jgi:Uma2 family endonuclease
VIPGLCLYPHGALSSDWLSDEDEVTVPPPVGVGVIRSPTQNLQPLVDKIKAYGQHGVKSCWLAEPATRVVSVFPAQGGSRAFAEGNVKDETLGIEVPVGLIFA